MVHSFPIKVRFNDLDGYNHVNNAVYLTYFEEGRIQFFDQQLEIDWNWTEAGLLLARVEIDYKQPLLFSDEARIKVWISKIGTKSFDINYRIDKNTAKGWQEITTGKSVQVCFNFKTSQSITIPENWRKILEAEIQSN